MGTSIDMSIQSKENEELCCPVWSIGDDFYYAVFNVSSIGETLCPTTYSISLPKALHLY